MKRLLLVGILLLCSATYAQDNELLAFVPANVDGFACLNMRELASHPKIRETLEKNDDQQLAILKDDMKASGIDIYTACSNGIVFFNTASKRGGSVFRTSVSEDKFNKLNAARIADGTIRKAVSGGRTVYVNGRASIAYLRPDIIGISDIPEEAIRLATLTPKENVSSNAKLMDMSSRADRKSAAWAVFTAKEDSAKSGKGNPMFPSDNIQGGALNINFTGAQKDTASIRLNLRCKDKGKAKQMSGLFQIIALTTIIPHLAQSNPAAADELEKTLKFETKDSDMVISADLSPALQNELRLFAETSFLGGQMPSMTAGKKKKKSETGSP